MGGRPLCIRQSPQRSPGALTSFAAPATDIAQTLDLPTTSEAGAPSLSRTMRQGGDFDRAVQKVPDVLQEPNGSPPALFANYVNKDGAPGYKD